MPERESLVTFLLEPFDGGTELTLLHEHLPDEEARESHEQGWSGLLDKLPVFLGECRMSDLILTTFDWVPEIAARLCARHTGALGAGRGGLALSRREHAVSRSQRRAFRASALRPGAVADRWRHLDLRERRDPAASRRASDALMPADPRGRSEAKEWLFAALNSVEMASLPWSLFMFSGDAERHAGLEAVRRVPPSAPPQAHGARAGRARMAGRHLLRRRHPDGGRAAPGRSVRRAGGTIPPVATMSPAPRPARPS